MKLDLLEDLWRRFQELPVIERQWPQAESLAALPALDVFDHEQATDLEGRFEQVRSFSTLPIVAVAGGKNAGKSSLIAAFLSVASRPRIPRGLKSELGTHRFTLWLPSSWEQNAELLARNKKTLADFFGHAAEPLSHDPSEAIHQQTRRDSIEVPLIAFDAALDEQGIALLDCPDIDSEPGNTAATNARLRMLSRAKEFCAGVILVTERAKIEADLLAIIAQHLPQAVQVHAINFVSDEAPHEVLSDLVHRLGRQPEYCFLAFSYKEEGYANRTPRIDPNVGSNAASDSGKAPFYFEVLAEPEANRPDRVTLERSILRLGKRLDPEVLRQRRQKELIAELKSKLQQALVDLEARSDENREVVERAAAQLFERCKDLFSEDGALTVQIDLQTLRAIADSLQRKAPWEFKILLWPYRGALKLLENEKIELIKEWLRRKKPHFKAPKGQGPLTVSNLCQTLAEWSAGIGLVRSPTVWEPDAQNILNRFSKEERTTLAKDEWDEIADALWKQTPKWQQRAALVAGLVAGLLALASAIADLAGGYGLFSLAYAKLLSVLGITGGLAALGETGRKFESLLKKLTWQQVSNFFGISADRVGVPREVPVDFATQFPPPRVASKLNRESYGVCERRWQLARIIPENVAVIRSEIQRLPS